jgi:hypothetical protein
LWFGDLPVGRGTAGEVLARPRDEFGAARLTAQKHLFLSRDQLD